MTITERTLKKWRKEALNDSSYKRILGGNSIDNELKELSERILRMTQELLDQHLINKSKE